MTHICVSKLTIIGSDNGLSPNRRQAIIWTNAGLLLIGPLGTNFIEILIEILTFSFKKMRLKVSSAKRRPFCLGLNELTEMMPWTSNHIRWLMRDVINHPCTCVIIPKSRLKRIPPSAAFMRQWIGSALVQIMAGRLLGTEPSSKPMLGCCHWDS